MYLQLDFKLLGQFNLLQLLMFHIIW